MKYEISGQVAKTLTIELTPGEQIIAQPGAVHSYGEGIEFAIRGGQKWHKRVFAGEDAFQLAITAHGGGAPSRQAAGISTRGDQPGRTPGTSWVRLASAHTGDLVAIELTPGHAVLARSGAYFASESTVKLDLSLMTNLTKGVFGGGFTRLRFSGPGLVFCDARGNVTAVTLADGESIYVDPEFLLAHQENTRFEMTRGKRSMATRILSREGLYMAHFTGPGRVWLDNVPDRAHSGWFDWFWDLIGR